MLKIKQFYLDEWKWFKERILTIFIFVLILFILSALVSHVFLTRHPDLAQKKAVDLAKRLLEKIPPQVTGFERLLLIFLNNSRVSLFSIVFGLIPFLFLPLLGAIANGVSVGIMTSISHLRGFKVVHVFLFSVAPHGIFEIPALIYASSIGVWLAFQISKRILFLSDGDKEPLFPFFIRIFRAWIGVILPLLLAAAMIETFVTPLLVKIFLER
jgi:stage II sporulation protein M